MTRMSDHVAAIRDTTVMGVSIAVPGVIGDELQERRASFGDPLAHAIPTYVTLLGPTSVGPGELNDLVAHLRRAAAETGPFTMGLRGTGTFRPMSDVVFVQVARGISACEQLERSIRSSRWASSLAFPYHPHVTIAHDVDEASLDKAFDDLADYSATFEVDSFHLYAQDVSGTWTPVRQFSLGEEP